MRHLFGHCLTQRIIHFILLPARIQKQANYSILFYFTTHTMNDVNNNDNNESHSSLSKRIRGSKLFILTVVNLAVFSLYTLLPALHATTLVLVRKANPIYILMQLMPTCTLSSSLYCLLLCGTDCISMKTRFSDGLGFCSRRMELGFLSDPVSSFFVFFFWLFLLPSLQALVPQI